MREIDWTLLARYAAGDCSPDERASLERRLTEQSDYAIGLSAINWVAAEARAAAPPERQAELFARLEATIAAEEVAVPFALSRRRRLRRAMRMAAAVIAAVALGAGLLIRGDEGRQPDRRETPIVVATTPRGQRATFRLSDGTRVVLGPGSTLRRAPRYGLDRRDVALEGEGYFEVVHDDRRPFVVRAGALVAEDLGTAFVVRAYPEDRHASVVVREGVVGIGGTAVRAGQAGYLSPAGHPVVEPADTAAAFAWTMGWLVFTRTPLREALPRLSRWYDLEFRLADSALGDIVLNGTFKEQLTDDGLEALAASLGVHHRRQDRVVTFSRRRHGS